MTVFAPVRFEPQSENERRIQASLDMLPLVLADIREEIEATIRALQNSIPPAGGESEGAAPTASVGLTVVPGTALTFTRSDAAPPLDQGIGPTWTGPHTFAESAQMQGEVRLYFGGTNPGDAPASIYWQDGEGSGLYLDADNVDVQNNLGVDGSLQVYTSFLSWGPASVLGTSYLVDLEVSGAVTVAPLAGTGTRLVTATSTGVLGNATTIAGAYTFSGAVTLSSTLGVSGRTTVASSVSVTGVDAPSSGSSLEFDYGGIANTGRIIAYDRTGGAYRAMRIGPSIDIAVSGAVSMSSSLSVTGNVTAGHFTNSASYTSGFYSVEASGSAYFQANDGATVNVRLAPAGHATNPYNYFRRDVIIGVEDATPLAVLDVRTSAAVDVIAAFGAKSSVNSTYPGAIYFSEVNTMNYWYNVNGNADGWINYAGYLNGTTQFRDLRIGDGKHNTIAFFEGASGRLGLGTASPSRTLDVVGNIGASGNITSGGTVQGAGLSSGSETFTYDEGTFTLNGSAGSFFDPAGEIGTARYVRFGQSVTLYIPEIIGAIAPASTSLIFEGIPTSIRPTRLQWVTISGIVNNTTEEYQGTIMMNTNGTFDVYRKTSASSLETNSYTAAGTKGLYACTITYSLL